MLKDMERLINEFHDNDKCACQSIKPRKTHAEVNSAGGVTTHRRICTAHFSACQGLWSGS